LKSYFQHAVDCRDIGAHWNNIKTRLAELRKTGRNTQTIEQWTAKNAPVSRRWLDEFGNFANEWPQFEEAWKMWQKVHALYIGSRCTWSEELQAAYRLASPVREILEAP
jgi:hypothetical protein